MNYKNIAFLFAIMCCTSQIIFSNSLSTKKLETLQEALKNNREMRAKLVLNRWSNANICFGIAILCSIAAGLSSFEGAPKGSFTASASTGVTTGVIGLVTSYNQHCVLNNLAEEEKQILQAINTLND